MTAWNAFAILAILVLAFAVLWAMAASHFRRRSRIQEAWLRSLPPLPSNEEMLAAAVTQKKIADSVAFPGTTTQRQAEALSRHGMKVRVLRVLREQGLDDGIDGSKLDDIANAAVDALKTGPRA